MPLQRKALPEVRREFELRDGEAEIADCGVPAHDLQRSHHLSHQQLFHLPLPSSAFTLSLFELEF